MRAGLALICWLLATAPALSEALIVTLSRPAIAVRSNFAGSQIVIFGGIERDGATVARRGYDIVITIRGPASDTTVRRKDRVMGLWVNRSVQTYSDLPGYYALLSNRPIAEITSPTLQAALGLGARTLVGDDTLAGDAGDGSISISSFDAALLAQRAVEGLYIAIPEGVAFLGRNLFRGTAILPANVPIGRYDVTVHLFSGGALLTSEAVDFVVRKAGFEQTVTAVARERPFLYGLSTVALAFFTGWLGSVIFRRD